MKKSVSLFLCLLLASVMASAAAQPGAAQFSWEGYTLAIAAASDDPSRAGAKPPNTGCRLILLRFESQEGDIKTSDIETFAGRAFLRGADGTVYGYWVTRVEGIRVENGAVTFEETQPYVDVLFEVPADAPTASLTLSIGTGGPEDSILFPLSELIPFPYAGDPAGDGITGDLTALITDGVVSARGRGQGLDLSILEMENQTESPVTVLLPRGLYLASQDPAVQNMLIIGEHAFLLPPFGSTAEYVASACMDIELEIPMEEDRFTVASLPVGSPLYSALAAFDARSCPFAVVQAAVWMISDGADYEALGVLTVDGQRFITREHYDEACIILEAIGVQPR